MRKKLQLAATFGLLAFSINGYSQRYLTEIFTSVVVTPDVTYGSNISVLTGHPASTDLKMDVYQPPVSDIVTARPLVIVLHTGSFLPAVVNGQATGGKADNAVVEMCTRLAKRGYVAVAADYRLGWNPISTSQDVRTGTLLQAVYRAIQDAKNCVRFFKNDKATTNTYKIDTTKIAVGGLGSGGYVALAYASLNLVSEIMLPKFVNFNTSQPYIEQDTLGNFDGTDAKLLNNPNYPSHTSTINMVFNIGGAIGDTTWINHGEVPIVGFHCTNDPFAPYKTSEVIVPTTGQNVVQASGSYDVLKVVNKPLINNNAVFHLSTYHDVYTTRANQNNHGYEGLFPFVTPAPGVPIQCGTGSTYPQLPQTEQGAPWDWWDQATYEATATAYGQSGPTVGCNAITGNPDMSAAKGKLYIDTIQGYLNPRMVCALGLAECSSVGIKEINEVSEINVFPNPSATDINFSIIGFNTIQLIELYDITGRMVKQISGLNTQDFILHREGISPGLYITKIQLNKGGVISKKIILE